MSPSSRLDTEFTRLLGCRYPIIAGPMFLVSDVDLVVAVSEAGGVGAMPSLNWRSPEEFREAVRQVKARTKNPFGVNIIVNKANPRVAKDLEVCVEEKVPEAARAQMKDAFEKTKEAWKQAASTDEGKKALAQACTQAMDAAQKAMEQFGCSWE